jgi:protein SCO1/2
MSDHNGNTITEKNLIGKYTILFFGFTYCPAICPTELQKITAAYVTLPKDVKDKLQLYFVSIDPERDTQEIMKNYVALFDPKWVGLRGDETQTNAMKKAYKVYGAKVPQGDTYTMDHSSFIYVMGPDGTLNQMFRGSDNAAKITEVLNDIVK